MITSSFTQRTYISTQVPDTGERTLTTTVFLSTLMFLEVTHATRFVSCTFFNTDIKVAQTCLGSKFPYASLSIFGTKPSTFEKNTTNNYQY